MNRRNFIRSAVALSVVPSSLFLIEGCNTDWVATAEADLPEITSVAIAIAGLASTGNPLMGAAVAAAIQVASTAAQQSIVVATAIINDYKATPSASTLQKLQTALVDVAKNLNGILSAAHVDNAGLQATIANGVAVALETVSVIISLIPVPGTKSTKWISQVGITSKKAPHLNTPSEIKARYNKVASHCGYPTI